MTSSALIASYRDALGTERTSPDWAVAEVSAILAEPVAGRYADVVRLRAGEPTGALAGRRLALEGGGELVLGHTVPADLPVGYHDLDGDDGPVLALHAPARVPAPDPARGWVLAAQLYAARGRHSWGHGDLRDARDLAAWVRAAGSGGYLMLNPLHAALPGPSPQPSPYFASTRAFRNPIYLAVDEVPGVDAEALAHHEGAARARNVDSRLDREVTWRHKHAVLAATWAHRATDPTVRTAVDRWFADPVNRRFAAISATDPGLGHPADADPAFHAWLQVLVEEQLRAVGPNVIHDVAVGTDRAGADARLWPGCFVTDGLRIGCPPDQFNTRGQDWGLPPLHPVALRAAGYEPFVRAVRAAVTGAAGVRIDHVMALERTFWIPERGEPADGVYVGYRLDEMLDVVAIEATRAGAFVVGEDLGTVPPAVPVALEARGILSYRVAAIDPEDPAGFPRRTMASVTTHDLPTVRGLLTGEDLAAQQHLGLHPNVADTEAGAARLRSWAAPHASDDDVVRAVHATLAASPAALAAATLDDLAGAVERPNMPGTIDQWPNWRIGLPRPLPDVLASPLAAEVRRTMAARVAADPA